MSVLPNSHVALKLKRFNNPINMVCEPNVHAHAAHTPPAMQDQTCVLEIYLRSQVRQCYVTGKTARTKCASNDVYDLLGVVRVLLVFFV